MANEIAEAISDQIVLTADMDVLDFGCGTGLVSLQLRPFVRSITGVDNSRGMLDVFGKKIAELKLDRVRAVYADIDKGDTLSGHYDIVLCNMTLHHIEDIRRLIELFYGIVAPGGHLCIADLDLDGGKFHRDGTGVFHGGFDRSALCEVVTEAGFDNVRALDAAEVVKPDTHGVMNRFSVFLLIGTKRIIRTEGTSSRD